MLVCMLAARNKSITEHAAINNGSIEVKATNSEDTIDETCRILSKLVIYYSDQSHSSAERSSLINLMRGRMLKSDDKHQLRGDVFEAAVKADLEKKLIPCFVSA
jgi:aromatic-L-amino-acid/L-tryptophan decarboxylase